MARGTWLAGCRRRWRWPRWPDCKVALVIAAAAATALGLCLRHDFETQAADEPAPPGHAVVVGIFTSYGHKSALRRRAILDTWLPQSDSADVRFVFVIGDPPARHRQLHGDDSSSDGKRWSTGAVQTQVTHGRLLHLDGVEDTYANLPRKSAAFFTAAAALARKFIIKVDDDIYFRPAVLPTAIARWKHARAGYIGCLKSGKVETRSEYKWHEPRAALFGDALMYPTHAWGSSYALSAATAASIAALNGGGAGLRLLSNEDVAVGLWALATGAVFLDDRRLCAPTCEGGALSVWDLSCTGLCSVEAQAELHGQPSCRAPLAAIDTARDADLYAPFYSFEDR